MTAQPDARGKATNGRSERVFLRGLNSATYGLREQREALLGRERVRGTDVVVDDGTWVAHNSQSARTRTWWRLSPGDEDFLSQTLQVHYLELSPHSENNQHGHQNEALFYVLDGAGYEIHDGRRYDWQAGDLVCVHADSVHQHFNPYDEPAHLLVIKAKSAWMFLGLLQQGKADPKADFEGYGPRHDWSALWTAGELDLAKVVRPTEQDWRLTPAGWNRPLSGPERPDVRSHSVAMTEHVIPPGSLGGRRWTMADEVVYVLEGRGTSLQWRVEAELDVRYHARIAEHPELHDIKAGDLLYVPTNTVAQLVNEDSEHPLRVLTARNRLFEQLGYRAVSYLESAPEWNFACSQPTPQAGEGTNA